MGEKPIKLDFSVTFQFKYCLAMMAGSLASSLLLYLYFDRGLGESYFDSLLTLRNLEQALPSSILITFVLQVVLILVLTIAINLFVSHKIAGPVYRYEQSLKDIMAGDLRFDVRTRDGDQLKSMVGSLNGFQNSLRDICKEAIELRNHVALLVEKGGETDPKARMELQRRIEALRARICRLPDSATEGA